jgi:hypothetical protein
MPIDFNQLLNQIGTLQQSLAEVHAKAPPSAERDLLGQLLAKIPAARAEVEQSYPKARTEIQQSLARTQAGIEAEGQKLAQHEAALAAAIEQAKQPPAPPSLPEVEFPPDLGQQLRNELLGGFGLPLPPRANTGGIREIWQDWDQWGQG